jgi:hypothetical protein
MRSRTPDTMKLEVFRDDAVLVGWCRVNISALDHHAIHRPILHTVPVVDYSEGIPGCTAALSFEAYGFAAMVYDDGRPPRRCVRLKPDQDPKHLPRWRAV